MKKAKLAGIIGGISFFLMMVLALAYLNSDFDHQLIRSVDSGVPAHELIPQIEDEKNKETIKAQKCLESHVIDPKYWGEIKSLKEEDYNYYKQICDEQLETITRYEEIRKQLVRKEISEEDFLREAAVLKPRLQI